MDKTNKGLGLKPILCLLLVIGGIAYFYSEIGTSSPDVSPVTPGPTPVPKPSPVPSQVPTNGPKPTDSPKPEPKEPEVPKKVRRFTYRVNQMYPHDTNSFTQGLEIVDGELYEGTGLNGRSKLMLLDIVTGKVKKSTDLARAYFGEGITVFKGKIYQLTWQSKVGFVYDQKTFERFEDQIFKYGHEGWGITHDDTHLIVSDGSDRIYFWSPEMDKTTKSFPTAKTLRVKHLDGTPAKRLNELEYIKGEIWANVWMEDKILIISPETGYVTGIIDLKGIRDTNNGYRSTDDVLNGIAYDHDTGKLYVTGKKWSTIYEITLVPKD